jgi:hypothetical protein
MKIGTVSLSWLESKGARVKKKRVMKSKGGDGNR